MTTVLITKQNVPFFKAINPRLKFKDETKNTCSFRTSKFNELRDKVREQGMNPFAVMYWY